MSLKNAKEKLQGKILFEDLPSVRSDDLVWKQIRESCDLTIGEFSALRNAACSTEDSIASMFHSFFNLQSLSCKLFVIYIYIQ